MDAGGAGDIDLQVERMELVATVETETDLEAREEIAGRVLSAWKELRKWERLLRWKEESGAPAVVLREMRTLTAESNVK